MLSGQDDILRNVINSLIVGALTAAIFRPLVMPGSPPRRCMRSCSRGPGSPGALSFLTGDSLFTLPVALSNAETGTYGAANYGRCWPTRSSR